MLGQHAQGNKIMGFAAAHRLGEFEEGLLGLALEAAESLQQQRFHAVGDEIFLEKILLLDFVLTKVGEIQNGVAF